MAKKKTEITPVAVDSPKGAIYYTDGGVRPTNPGYGGYGFHGYVYSDQDPKKGSGNPTNIVTDVGYLEKTDTKKPEHKPVKPLQYINGYGTIPGLVTNNVAEISAATWALANARTHDLEKVTIITDSKGVVEAANGWIAKWSQNGWLKSDGRPVANQDHWQILDAHMQYLQEKGIEVEFKWIKGHNDHLGNEISDKLATIGVMKCRAGQNYSSVDSFPAEGYWTQVIDKHPLLSQRRLYMSTDPATIHPGQYYLGNHGKDDELLGARNADGYFSYVELTEHDPIIEAVRVKQIDVCAGHVGIVMVRLDKVFEKNTHLDLHRYGTDCLYRRNPRRFDLSHVSKQSDEEPVSKELNPPLLAWRAIEALNVLKTLMNEYSVNNPEFVKTDITDLVFETTDKGVAKLRPTFDVGFVGFKADAQYGEAGEKITVDLMLGVDMPERNSLKRLEKLQPKINLVTWMESPQMFRYASVVETSTGRAVFAGVYSNTRVLPTPSPSVA
jgi:ribonuclease HI